MYWRRMALTSSKTMRQTTPPSPMGRSARIGSAGVSWGVCSRGGIAFSVSWLHGMEGAAICALLPHPPFVAFWCGGPMALWTNIPELWRTSHLGGVDGRASGPLELRPSGARRRPATQPKPSQRKRRHHDHAACGTEAHQRCDPAPFEEEQRNHPGCHHLLDRIVSRGRRDA